MWRVPHFYGAHRGKQFSQQFTHLVIRVRTSAQAQCRLQAAATKHEGPSSRTKEKFSYYLVHFFNTLIGMNNKLFVGGLSFDSTEQGMAEAFAAAGSVKSAKIMMDKMTGRSRGFGFVEMGSDEEAQKAIEMFNGQALDGRKITVSIARPMEARAPRRDFNRGGDRGGSY